MARIVSAPTSVTVTSLPAWLPVGGSWASVSLNKFNTATVKGDFPPQFPASRNLQSLFKEYTGAIWNPYLGAHGAWLIMGGGHMQYLGNEVYAWLADTRQWTRLSDPTYPGQNSTGTSLAALGDWQSYKEPPFASDLLNAYGELSPGVPAANHSRWHPCIIPPSLGGGPQGSLLIAHLSAIHTSGNGGAAVAHAFDCSIRKWTRIGTPSTLADGGRAWSSCLDTRRGVIYRPGEKLFTRMSIGSGTWAHAGISVNGSPYASSPCVYLHSLDAVVILGLQDQIGLVDAAAGSSIITATVTGDAPTPAPYFEGRGITWAPDLGPNGSVCRLDYSTGEIFACAAPSAPFRGVWTWSRLIRTNSAKLPTYSAYNHFQYAPSLKSFFVANGQTDEMWCFRPREIAG